MYPHRSPAWFSLILALVLPIGSVMTIAQASQAAEVKPIGQTKEERKLLAFSLLPSKALAASARRSVPSDCYAKDECSAENVQAFKEKSRLELIFLKNQLWKVRKEGDQKASATILHKISDIYVKSSRLEEALDSYQESLDLYRKLGDYQSDASVVVNVADTYFRLREFKKSENWLRQNMEFYKKSDSRQATDVLFNELRNYLKESWAVSAGCGKAASSRLQYRMINGKVSWREILEIENFNLFVLTQVGDIQRGCTGLTKGELLHGIGWTYRNLGNYSQALASMKEAIDIQRQKLGEPEQLLVIDLGTVYIDLGQYDLAIKVLQESLKIKQGCQCKCNALGKIGFAYKELGDYSQALKYLKQAEEFGREDTNHHDILNYLGEVYAHQGEYDKALTHFQNALAAPSPAGEQSSRGFVLNNIGLIYQKTNRPMLSFENYQHALTTFQELGDRAGERLSLSRLGDLLKYQGQPELAIIFYKQSVNVTEKIRQDMRTISLSEQKTYTQTVVSTYRALADLLIEQSRIGEAQQVLELLKIQELKDFDPVVRAKVDRDGKTIELDNSEKKIVSEHGTFIAFGHQLRECEDKNEDCKELKQKRVAAEADYDRVVQSFEQEIKDRKIKDEKNFLDPKNPLNAKAQEIIQAQPNTALIYTLVTEKRLWIVLATQSEVLRSFKVDVTQAELSKTVAEFQDLTKRCELRNCTAADTAAFKVVSQQLHTWLFPKDLQTELQGTKTTPKIEHLVFALDRVTRYIPMASLFDGQKYLIQDYTVATIVSADSTRSERLPDTAKTKVLAFGLSNAVLPDFPRPLTAVIGELKSILRDETDATDQTHRFPGRKFLNEQFTTANLEQYLPKRQILHVATHGEFVGGSQEQSYILLGDGRKFKISEMLEKLHGLPGVNLVVLSACQTALASKDSTGVEISSVGNAFFEKGVKSVVASLWNVSDGSTSLLMQEFYKHLAEGKTKTAALREAQLDLMTGQKTEKDVPRGNDADVKLTQKPGTTRAPTNQPTDYRHPYYWAPFILIGNGL